MPVMGVDEKVPLLGGEFTTTLISAYALTAATVSSSPEKGWGGDGRSKRRWVTIGGW